MGGPNRAAPGGLFYQVLHRANGQMAIFTMEEEFLALETVRDEAVAPTGTRLISY